jgi:rhodanese-related sulfurtransferase
MCCLKTTTKGQKRTSNLKMEKGNDDEGNNNNYNNFQLPIICDAHTLQILIQKKTVRIVDVRKEEEYQQDHIPTAASIPLAQILKKDSPQEIINILQNMGISDNMPVVVYDDTFGALAARVAWTFQYIGHTNTRNDIQPLEKFRIANGKENQYLSTY